MAGPHNESGRFTAEPLALEKGGVSFVAISGFHQTNGA